ncbi:MAG: hypothetical protein KR126chlam3_00063 [Chlamydiae bacterium]|nr:hypothetical protein [Chlamydiota bacterium]
MSERKTSKEERFLQKLYEFAESKGDPEGEIDRYEVGRAIGEHTKSTDHSVQILAKIGFIKKSENNLIYLTDAGLRFLFT